MSEETTTSPSKPAVGLGLTFLFIGLTFALPFHLIPDKILESSFSNMSQEVANVYAVVAWAGWAHFIFAFRGQVGSLLKRQRESKKNSLFTFTIYVLVSIVILVALRWAIGPVMFSVLVWIYFIDHFIKAERSFAGHGQSSVSILVRWLSSCQQILTFSWLSAVLLGYRGLQTNYWALWCGSLLLAIYVLAFGGWKKLAEGNSRGTLLSLFFIGEALVWGTFGQYGGVMFLNGVYVVHIAAGSYFHYLGSYFFARSKARTQDKLLSPISIIAINFGVVALGILVTHQSSLSLLVPILGIQWFTLWVAVHLISSDLLPWIKSSH